MSDEVNTRWPVVALAIASGMIAAAAMGKVPPAVGLLRQEYSLSLVYAGWIVSIFSALIMVTGVGFGALADRYGLRTALLAGLWAQVSAGLVAVLASSPLILLGTRLIEGVGFLAVGVAAPGIIIAASAPRDRSWSLGLWSVYVPVGISLAMVSAMLALDLLGWRGLWMIFAALAAMLALIGHWLLPHGPGPAAQGAATGNLLAVLQRPGSWLLAGSFTAYTLMWISIMAWLPTYLTDQREMTVAGASLLTAVTVAANVPGNLLGTWLLHRRWHGGTIAALSAVIMGFSIFVVFDGRFSDGVRYGSCLIFSCAGGMLPAAILGTSRLHAPDPQRISTINGLIIQGSHLGLFTGPLLVAMVVTAQGSWESVQLYMVGCALIALVLSWWLRQVESRQVQGSPLMPKGTGR
ncbi:MAG: MFS transporter [Arenicellales bacterium]|nr:MFS transporter [Arenicellales bacterium]